MGFSFTVQPEAGEVRNSGLRVVSANVESWAPALGQRVQALQALRPDILLLQEVWSDKHLELFRRAWPDWHFLGDPSTGVAIGCAFPLVSGEAPPCPENAVLAVAEVDQRKLLLVSLHGRKQKGFRPHEISTTLHLQNEQAEELTLLLREATYPTVLGGDLNSLPSGPLPRKLSATLVDAFRVSGQGYGYTFPNALPLMRIDYLYTSPSLRSRERARVEDFGSDHRCVVADLRL